MWAAQDGLTLGLGVDGPVADVGLGQHGIMALRHHPRESEASMKISFGQRAAEEAEIMVVAKAKASSVAVVPGDVEAQSLEACR